jgi:predicted dehydrogenase
MLNQTFKMYNRRPLRVAFIGGGINSAVGRSHFSALQMDGLYKLVAGCFSRNPKINLESGKAYKVRKARIYDNIESLIKNEKENIDAIIILTPTTFHVEPVIAALEAHIPVICEKALATNLEEIRKIYYTEVKNKGFLVVTYNYTGYPALRELRKLIKSGNLGRILHFVAEMPQEGFIRCGLDGKPIKPQEWRLKDGKVPTVYLDLGVHLHQIVHYLIGAKPRQVIAFHNSYGNFPEVIDFVSASVEFEGNIHGNFYFGKSMLGYRNGLRFRIFGSEASVEWEQVHPEEIRVAYANGQIEILDRGSNKVLICNQLRYSRFKAGHPAGYIEAFANIYADIYETLLGFLNSGNWTSDEIFGSALAQEGMNLLEAMALSAKTRSIIRLED